MKKLLTLVAILPAISLSAPSFGVDWIRDRIYTSSSYGNLGINYDLGYHYTDSVKISVGPVVKPILNSEYQFTGLEGGAYGKASLSS
ncbi:hypothetical protein MWH06_07440 [Wolbachia pipientis]|nr:hypothetical protein MWH06_07440 [Wolbachia pipientis]